MASPKKIFAKLNISIKPHFCFLHVFLSLLLSFRLFISYTYMHFFSSILFLKVLKNNVHRIISLYTYWCLIYIFLGLGMGRGREFREGFFICFRMGWRGDCIPILHVYCATFHVSGSCVTRHKKGIWMYIVWIICMYNFNSINK